MMLKVHTNVGALFKSSKSSRSSKSSKSVDLSCQMSASPTGSPPTNLWLCSFQIPDTLPEVPPQTSLQPPRTSENEKKCPGDVKQAGGGKEKLGVDVDDMASHLNWHLPGEASNSPKSVLDRAQSSSPESTEDESMELGLSGTTFFPCRSPQQSA